MVNEVESILNEIRERVRTEEKQREAAVAIATQNGNDSNPAISPTAPAIATESLARLEAHLTTTSRAWDRLPPLFSNRKGVAARFELWIKARLKSLSRWFTWEQVNFNSAVHHGLSDALGALRAHEEQLIKLQTELNQTKESLRAEFNQATEALRSESHQRTEALQADFAHTAEELRAESSQANEALASELRQTAASLRASIDARAAETDARLSELGDDLHEEQRVCFKQLSLETSEAAVLEDRGRRALAARLEKLEQLRSEKKS